MNDSGFDQYIRALRAGQKYYNTCMSQGKYPYPQVLSTIFPEYISAGHVKLGLCDIPADLITGTASEGRKTAFAGNFMPLLKPESEFAVKWSNLCDAHLSDTGIRDPISCYEYLGHFYVTEGNKRVSVLRSYDSPTIAANVIRILPLPSDDPSYGLYHEFLAFYKLSGIFDVQFTTPGNYIRLQSILGFEEDHKWTNEERIDFLFTFRKLKAYIATQPQIRDSGLTSSDILMLWLKLYPFNDLNDSAIIAERFPHLMPDIRILANGGAISFQTEAPPENVSGGGIGQWFGFGRINHLNIAFIHSFPASISKWTEGHELGKKHLENVLGERVTCTSYVAEADHELETMELALSEGAQVIFATTAPMIDACRQIALKHPEVNVFNCSTAMPYAGVRTYYSRLYEAKWITGAIAGTMADGNKIGYVANYPILGSIASINAFALGARMTNPRAQIRIEWSCLPGNPVEKLREQGVEVISNRDTAGGHVHHAWEWGTYIAKPAGEMEPLASPSWNWGMFYEKVVNALLNKNLNNNTQNEAVNYLWGVSSGVIDVALSENLPEGVSNLAKLMKRSLEENKENPFACKIIDKDGIIHNPEGKPLSVQEALEMDYLCDNVIGYIPEFNELLPASRKLVRLLGIYRDRIPPEKEEGATL